MPKEKEAYTEEFVKTLSDQALKEIKFAYDYRKPRTASWNKNEDMYYGRKVAQSALPFGGTMAGSSTEPRASVNLGKMQGFVHTLLSKIDTPLTFKYIKGENADEKRAALLNAIKEKDAKIGRWNFKDILGKKHAIIYGRAIYLYYADSSDGYSSHLENIKPKDFLIDPDAGGIDTELADYLGWWNTKLTKKQLEDGAKSGLYIKKAVDELIAGGGNEAVETEIDQDNANGYAAYGAKKKKRIDRKNQFRFYTWFTKDENDEKWYLVLTPSGKCVRCVKWSEISKSERYPIWTWAAFPDADEFWTPSYADYVREIFMAQEKSINQSLDNSEQVNNPQKAVNVDYIRNLAQVKYKAKGYIEIEGNVDVNKVIQSLVTPPIETPMRVYDKLEQIVQGESGVNQEVKATGDEKGKVGIYEGNLQQAGDRFGLLNKSYAEGYYQFAVLYKEGVWQHMKKKTAVEIAGPMGLEIEMITMRDLKPSKVDYDILVESSLAETQSNAADQKNKMTFLSTYVNNDKINQKKLFEIQAKVVGFEEDDIKQLLDTSDYGNVEMLAQANEDFQRLIAGRNVPIYKHANNAYRQQLLDMSEKYENELTDEQHKVVLAYIESIGQVVERNMVRKLASETAKLGAQGAGGGLIPTDGAPVESIVPGAIPDGGAMPADGMPAPAKIPAAIPAGR